MTKTASTIRSFAGRHDSLPAFHAGYFVVTLLVASLLHLGTFALLIIAHMTLDFVKHREFHRKTFGHSISAMLRENLLDVTFFSIALGCAVYFHHSMPIIAAFSGLLRALLTVLGAIGTTLPKWAITHSFTQAFRNVPEYLSKTPVGNARFSGLEAFCIFATCFNIVIIAVSPLLLNSDMANLLGIISNELHLW